MQSVGAVAPNGHVSLRVVRPTEPPARLLSWREVVRYGMPQRDQTEDVQMWKTRNLLNLVRGARRVAAARALRLPHFYGRLWLKVFRASGEEFDLGLVSMRVVTDAGVAYIVDAFQNSVELENMKYHGLGTGTTAEAAGDTALVTELTTEYNPNSTRATGTTTEGASANIYRTVATNTIDSGTPAVTEHGVFSAASAGTLLDRTKFAAINLVSGDGIQSTYELTLTAGS